MEIRKTARRSWDRKCACEATSGDRISWDSGVTEIGRNLVESILRLFGGVHNVVKGKQIIIQVL